MRFCPVTAQAQSGRGQWPLGQASALGRPSLSMRPAGWEALSFLRLRQSRGHTRGQSHLPGICGNTHPSGTPWAIGHSGWPGKAFGSRG